MTDVTCDDLRAQYDDAVAHGDTQAAQTIRQQMLEAGCPDPLPDGGSTGGQSGGGGHLLPPKG